jgi:hypothetical protein
LVIFISLFACFEIRPVSTRQLFRGFVCQTLLVVGGQHFAGDGCSGLHDQASNFAFQFGQHAGVIRSSGFARFGNDLFRGGNGFLRFTFLNFGSGGASVFNGLVRLCVGLR